MARKERKIRAKQPYREEGLRLRAYRLARHGDRDWKDYAEDAQLDAHAYRQNENGITCISPPNALLLKQHYGISLDWIYAGDDTGLPIRTIQEIRAELKKLTKI